MCAQNPDGFHESSLIGGINFSTNPDPVTGARLAPADRVVVKVLTYGLRRTERAYLDHVVWSVRPWRDVLASAHRFEAAVAMAGNAQAFGSDEPVWKQWCREFLATLEDADRRGYSPLRVPLAELRAAPREVVGSVARAVGIDADVEAASMLVQPLAPTAGGVLPEHVPPAWVSLLDAVEACANRRELPGRAEIRALREEMVALQGTA